MKTFTIIAIAIITLFIFRVIAEYKKKNRALKRMNKRLEEFYKYEDNSKTKQRKIV